MEEINLATETDQTKLKSLAYDYISVLENAQNNLRAINTRLAELQQATTTTTTMPPADV
jgi:hypothetical protein